MNINEREIFEEKKKKVKLKNQVGLLFEAYLEEVKLANIFVGLR